MSYSLRIDPGLYQSFLIDFLNYSLGLTNIKNLLLFKICYAFSNFTQKHMSQQIFLEILMNLFELLKHVEFKNLNCFRIYNNAELKNTNSRIASTF